MKNCKKILCVLIVMLLITSITACGNKSKNDKVVTIGISQYAENTQSDNTRKGIVQGLRESGYAEGTNVIFKYENAKGISTNTDKISQKFVDDKVDMIISIGTSSTKSAINFCDGTDIPVVYACVTDPASIGAVDKSNFPLVNATGTIDKVNVNDLLTFIKKINENTKNIGIIFAKKESSSKKLIDEFKYYGTSVDINILSISINKTSEIDLAFNTIKNKVDAIVLINDNIIATVNQNIIDLAKNSNLPVYGIEKSQVKNGAMLGYCVDYLKCGKETGKIAANILQGADPKKINPVELNESNVYINDEAANYLNIKIPDEIRDQAEEIY